MKAVYIKTAMDRLYELKYEAERTRRKIDYFLVTPEEWVDIRRECPPWRYGLSAVDLDSCPTFETVQIKTPSGLRMQNRGSSPYTNFPVQHGRILGERVVVAPKEYH